MSKEKRINNKMKLSRVERRKKSSAIGFALTEKEPELLDDEEDTLEISTLILERMEKRVPKKSKKKDINYTEVPKKVTRENIDIVKFDQVNKESEEILRSYFKNEILPLLSKKISRRKELNLNEEGIFELVILQEKTSKKIRIGIVSYPFNSFPQLIEVPYKKNTYVTFDHLVFHFMPLIFKGFKIKEKTLLYIGQKGRVVDPRFDLVSYYNSQLKAANRAANVLNDLERTCTEYLNITEDDNWSSENMRRANEILMKYGGSVNTLLSAYKEAQIESDRYNIDSIKAKLSAAENDE